MGLLGENDVEILRLKLGGVEREMEDLIIERAEKLARVGAIEARMSELDNYKERIIKELVAKITNRGNQ